MPAVEPLRVAFRRQLREQAIEQAHRLTLANGWDQVRVNDVAEATGVSRPTLYKEFGSKQGLGEAMVLRETERFLAGVSSTLDAHVEDPATAITAAVRFTLDEAAQSPLLRAVLTSARGDDALLPLLTRSEPVLMAATSVLTAWFAEHQPSIPAADVAEGVDALVRLAVSHIVLPSSGTEVTAERLARLALRYLDPARASSAARR